MAHIAWFEDCWYQVHIYPVFTRGPAPHLSIWTLKGSDGWEEKRQYISPYHVALMEQARRYVSGHQPAEWFF
jgi:hypothetical protein